MEQYVKDLMMQYVNLEPDHIIDLGGGFYGRVFLAEISRPPHQIVVKLFLTSGLCEREKQQIEMLTSFATLKMPQIYAFIKANDHIPYDALLMEYIEGKNAGSIEVPEASGKIAEQIVDNLISWHHTIHKEGFGALHDMEFKPMWNDYYKEKAKGIVENTLQLYHNNKISKECYDIVNKAFAAYDQIFYIPITEASLIHGDYNNWNILLNHDLTEAIAVIDPYECCYADPEYDLYQLNNANGKAFGLLDLYKKKQGVSPNFDIKLCFYELFTEIMHYYNSNVEPDKDRLDQMASQLNLLMK